MLTIKLVLTFALFGLSAAQWDPHFVQNRSSIVHLFEWRWNDIAEECERFLAPYGYGGVQVSPVSENAVINSPSRPWWERYQPVSYSCMTTRSGTEQEFQSMVRRCNNVGVRIYVDIILNHMTGPGSGRGTCGNSYSGSNFQFPEYSAPDFNGRSKCPSSSGGIENWQNAQEVRNCTLVGLTDLDQGKQYVRDHMVGFMRKLVEYGVAGFRVDAAKHMWPAEMKAIFDRLPNLPTDHGFSAGSRAFIYQEVIEGGASEPIRGSHYFDLGRVTEFKYGRFLGEAFRGQNLLKWLVNWGTGWGMFPDANSLVFIDNHDNQRGHGSGGESILTFRQSRLYKMATAFMLAHPYGQTRVMSSYFWTQDIENGADKNDWIGPPNNNGVTLPVIVNPDLTCGNGWMCEHRWRPIYNMNIFRSVVAGTAINNWWDNGSNQIAFCRGGKGFIAINGDHYPLDENLQTCLPAGQYCDVITGNKVNGACTGLTVTVGSDSKANIQLTNVSEDPVVAIHVDSKL